MQTGCVETPLHEAAERGHAEVVKVLLANGAEVNIRNDHGYETPLHKAASSGRAEVVKELLAAGGDVNARDDEGKTPLHWDTHPRI